MCLTLGSRSENNRVDVIVNREYEQALINVMHNGLRKMHFNNASLVEDTFAADAQRLRVASRRQVADLFAMEHKTVR